MTQRRIDPKLRTVVSRAPHAVVVTEEVGDLLVSGGSTAGRQELWFDELPSRFGEDLLAKRGVAPQFGLGLPLAISFPLFLERFERFVHHELASVEAYARALDAHDPLSLGERQGFHERVDGDAIMLGAHVREERSDSGILFLRLFGLALLLGKRPRVFVAEFLPLLSSLARGTLRLTTVSLGLNPTL
jgi:hypothetical protein